MATLSEIYFTTADKDWTYDGQEGERVLRSGVLCK